MNRSRERPIKLNAAPPYKVVKIAIDGEPMGYYCIVNLDGSTVYEKAILRLPYALAPDASISVVEFGLEYEDGSITTIKGASDDVL